MCVPQDPNPHTTGWAINWRELLCSHPANVLRVCSTTRSVVFVECSPVIGTPPFCRKLAVVDRPAMPRGISDAITPLFVEFSVIQSLLGSLKSSCVSLAFHVGPFEFSFECTASTFSILLQYPSFCVPDSACCQSVSTGELFELRCRVLPPICPAPEGFLGSSVFGCLVRSCVCYWSPSFERSCSHVRVKFLFCPSVECFGMVFWAQMCSCVLPTLPCQSGAASKMPGLNVCMCLQFYWQALLSASLLVCNCHAPMPTSPTLCELISSL